MLSNILIAIGFFIWGGAVATWLCVRDLRKARKEFKNHKFIVFDIKEHED